MRSLSAALISLSRLESGKHNVTYGVCCDNDDPETISFCVETKNAGQIQFAYRTGPRPKTLGGLVNDMSVNMPAEVYVLLGDDTLCLSYGWDDVIAKAVGETPHGVFFWKNALPMDVTYCIVTEKWRKAAGCLFTDHYPFWYDDLALIEQYVMATDSCPRVLDILIADKPDKTHRMRDLKFWQDFFLLTRQHRIERGKEIAANLGIAPPQKAEWFAAQLTEKFHRLGDDVLQAIEANQGDQSAPDPSYLAAKSRAESVFGLHKSGLPLSELLVMSPERLWHLSNEHPGCP